MASESNDFLFSDQDDEQLLMKLVSDFWDVLIVDDDPEIHSVTKLALSGVEFWDKGCDSTMPTQVQKRSNYLKMTIRFP